MVDKIQPYSEGYGEGYGCGFALSFGLLVEIRELEDANLERVYSERTKGGRQIVLETLRSKFQFILHITRFLHYRVLNSNAGIFYCPKATLDRCHGKNLPKTRLLNCQVIKVTQFP